MELGIKLVKNLIAVGAGKGGVGKSTVTCHLALSLRDQGFKVGICDLDLYGPSLGKMIPLETVPTPYEGGLIPAQAQGLKLMSIAYFNQGLNANFIRAPIANGLLKQFLNLVYWGDLDFLLFDCPPGTSDIHMTLMQEVQVQAALLVTTPQEVSLLDVRKAAQMFDKMQVPLVGFIENMSYMELGTTTIYPFGQSHANLLEDEFNMTKLGVLPVDSVVSKSCDIGLNESTISAQFKKIFENIAEKILNQLSQMEKIPSLDLTWDKNLGL